MGWDERTSELGVGLLHIAQPLRELLDGYVLAELEEMLLCGGPGVVHERDGVRGVPCYPRDDVPIYRMPNGAPRR